MPPELFVDKQFEEAVTLKRGQSTAFEIPFKGNPQPSVKWTYNEAELPDIKRMEVETIRNMTTVRLAKVIRTDTGEYTLTLENNVGKATLTIKLNVLGELSFFKLCSNTCTFVIKKSVNQSKDRDKRQPFLLCFMKVFKEF